MILKNFIKTTLFLSFFCLSPLLYASAGDIQHKINFINSIVGVYRLESQNILSGDRSTSFLKFKNHYIRILVVQRSTHYQKTEDKLPLDLTAENFSDGELVIEKVFVDVENNEVVTEYLMSQNLSDVAEVGDYSFPVIPETPFVPGNSYYSNVHESAENFVIDPTYQQLVSLHVSASVDETGPFKKTERQRSLQIVKDGRLIFHDFSDEYYRPRGFLNWLKGKNPKEWIPSESNMSKNISVLSGVFVEGLSTRLRLIGELHGIFAVDRLDDFRNLTGTNSNNECFEFLAN